MYQCVDFQKHRLLVQRMIQHLDGADQVVEFVACNDELWISPRATSITLIYLCTAPRCHSNPSWPSCDSWERQWLQPILNSRLLSNRRQTMNISEFYSIIRQRQRAHSSTEKLIKILVNSPRICVDCDKGLTFQNLCINSWAIGKLNSQSIEVNTSISIFLRSGPLKHFIILLEQSANDRCWKRRNYHQHHLPRSPQQ